MKYNRIDINWIECICACVYSRASTKFGATNLLEDPCYSTIWSQTFRKSVSVSFVVNVICVKTYNLAKTQLFKISDFKYPLTAPGNSIAQSEMMRPEVNICFCFLLITLISCKPEEHMKQNDRFCSKQGLVRNEDNNLQHFMVTVSQSKLLKKRTHIHITCKSAFYLYMLILQAGDIQIQPGPTYIKYPCGICSKNVNWNAKALQPYNVTAVISGTIQSVQTYHHIFTKHFKVTTWAGYAFNAAYQTSQLHFSKPKNVLKYRTDLTP